MTTTEPIRPPAQSPSFSTILAETVPLVDAIAGYGPPVIFIAGPWILFALLLAAPFAVLLTLIAAMVLAAAVLVGLIAGPYLLVRHLHRAWARRTSSRSQAAHLVPVRSTPVAS